MRRYAASRDGTQGGGDLGIELAVVAVEECGSEEILGQSREVVYSADRHRVILLLEEQTVLLLLRVGGLHSWVLQRLCGGLWVDLEVPSQANSSYFVSVRLINGLLD